MKKISIIIGTRPEAIKLIPLVLELRKRNKFQVEVCSTGQHKEMLAQVFDLFQINPNVELDLMTHNQTLPELSALILTKINGYLNDSKPDFLISQGDTSTAFIAGLAAFYHKIPVGHVEAGLRTYDKYSPFPEEMNRQLLSRIADLHFAPTQKSQEALLQENIPADKIKVTGNTVIDSLFLVRDKIENNQISIRVELSNLLDEKPFVLITGHRRENFGQGFENICNAIQQLAEKFENFNFIYPVHLNPNVKTIVESRLGSIKNVKLIAPLDYIDFVYAMSKSFLVLTDSGGVQEEAPSLKKPVLVMRENSERMEGVECGLVKLVGTNVSSIVNHVTELIENSFVYKSMTTANNPYGDGQAAQHISEIIEDYFNL